MPFAATGDPNREGLPGWPAYDAAGDRYLVLGDEINVEQGVQRELMDLFTEGEVTTEPLPPEDS